MIETSLQYLGRQEVRESLILLVCLSETNAMKHFLALFTSKNKQLKMARKSRNALKIAEGANLPAGKLL